jgi:hypothetical protein
MAPVPAHRVQEVYNILAQAPAVTMHEPAPASGPEDGWTEQLVRRMIKESGDPMQRMLRMLADADGEEVSTNEIAAALDLPKGAASVAGNVASSGPLTEDAIIAAAAVVVEGLGSTG